ncbi:putative arabinogalactan peptide, AGP [Medicago truncatula]|uniref:Arabinogalactan protein n=1 Tax=Medicago truncatula TaxID=3880 RepID=G7L8Y2_MEDTR|nr:arabinogalactan protein [Medicago truncatula]RHN43689.1 putative arabinogalactan peptide, AGP [Medicago truncatula]
MIEMKALRFFSFSILSLVLFAISEAHDFSPSPTPAPAPAPAPSSDGTAFDQGIAYFLMLVALLITYMFH